MIQKYSKIFNKIQQIIQEESKNNSKKLKKIQNLFKIIQNNSK
jgi:hypothetical protein